MSVLSGQTIRRLCTRGAGTNRVRPYIPNWGGDVGRQYYNTDHEGWKPLIEPQEERRRHEGTGMTYGLGPAGYDVRLRDAVRLVAGHFALAVTVERFCLPDDVIMTVMDKSTLARLGLGLGNTVAEPGWEGWLTLELSNHGENTIELQAGQPIAQVLFQWLDEPTERPYAGRYQNQEDVPVKARFLTEDEK